MESIASRLGYEAWDERIVEILDSEDELKGMRRHFHIPPSSSSSLSLESLSQATNVEKSIYMCGNSLGCMPIRARHYVSAELDKWATLGVEGHFDEPLPWVSIDESVRDGSARLVGAKREEVVVMNSLTVNLHLMMVSFYRPNKLSGKVKILVEEKAFPSDMHMLESQVRYHGLDPEEVIVKLAPRPNDLTLRVEDIIETITRLGDPSRASASSLTASNEDEVPVGTGELALVLMSGVQYYTGQFFDIEGISKAARQAGAMCGWDLAHAVGNVPLNLHDDGPDFACWCTYKYLNSGPGNIAGCFIHERHGSHTDLESLPRFAGWWGHRKEDRFLMAPKFVPSQGAQGFMCSNPPVLCCATLRASLECFEEAGGIVAIRRKSILLTGFLEELLESDVVLRENVKVFTPRDHRARGCQLSLAFKGGGVEEVNRRLAIAGVICDVRKPDVMRVAPAPLYNSFADVRSFAFILKETLMSISRERCDGV